MINLIKIYKLGENEPFMDLIAYGSIEIVSEEKTPEGRQSLLTSYKSARLSLVCFT